MQQNLQSAENFGQNADKQLATQVPRLGLDSDQRTSTLEQILNSRVIQDGNLTSSNYVKQDPITSAQKQGINEKAGMNYEVLETRRSTKKKGDPYDDDDDLEDFPKKRRGQKTRAKKEADNSSDDSYDSQNDCEGEELDKVISSSSPKSDNEAAKVSEHATEKTIPMQLGFKGITSPEDNVIDLVSQHSKHSQKLLMTPMKSNLSSKLSMKQRALMNSAIKKVNFFELAPSSHALISEKNSQLDSTQQVDEIGFNKLNLDAMNKSIEQSTGETSSKMKRNIKSFNFTQAQLTQLYNNSNCQ